MPLTKKKPAKGPDAQVRIIGGQWRGRKLPVLDQSGLRPTGGRVRETLFNWLAPYIHGANCLDAFAGTGALGLEALSRGAAFTHFVELQRTTAAQLRHNIERLSCETAAIDCSDFSLWQPAHQRNFDIIFIDPPFAGQLWQSAVDHVHNNLPLAEGALVYIESGQGLSLSTPPEWSIIKQKNAGAVQATLYKTMSPNPR